jgi:hypothetical protein
MPRWPYPAEGVWPSFCSPRLTSNLYRQGYAMYV